MNNDLTHAAIEGLKRRAASLYATIESESERAKRELADLNGEPSRKKYSADHLKEQAESIRERVKTFAALQDAELKTIAARLGVAGKAWQTATLMRRARLTPEGDKIENDLLEELRRMRLAGDLQSASPDELIETANEARESANLAMLAIIKRETARRQFGSDLEAAKVKIAINKAVDEVQPQGQREALQILADTQLGVEMASDTLAELTTGQTPKRLEMRRMMALRSNETT